MGICTRAGREHTRTHSFPNSLSFPLFMALPRALSHTHTYTRSLYNSLSLPSYCDAVHAIMQILLAKPADKETPMDTCHQYDITVLHFNIDFFFHRSRCSQFDTHIRDISCLSLIRNCKFLSQLDV